MKRKLSFDEIDQIKSLDQINLDRGKDPTIYGIGVLDVDFCIANNGVMCRQYNLWKTMFCRCYSFKEHQRHPTYINCSVCNDWIYFSNFLVWCNNQEGYKMKDENGNSFALDKDIANKGNKVYSNENCSFIPASVNNLLVKADGKRGKHPIGVYFHGQHQRYRSDIRIGSIKKTLGYFDTEVEAFRAYKAAKEAECKRIANLYKDVISPLVYESLMSYTVNIDD